MEKSQTNTLKLITLQNQLLLTIGGTLDTHECMRIFMQATLKKLRLKSIHLYILDHSLADKDTFIPYLSIPDNRLETEHKPTIDKTLQYFKNNKGKTHLSEKINDDEILAYAFSSFGALLLEKQQDSLQPAIKDALVPVISKLADHFQVCEQQKRLTEEAKINKKAQRTYKKATGSGLSMPHSTRLLIYRHYLISLAIFHGLRHPCKYPHVDLLAK